MVGPAGLVTVMENAPRAADCEPLLTLIVMFGYVPVCPVAAIFFSGLAEGRWTLRRAAKWNCDF